MDAVTHIARFLFGLLAKVGTFTRWVLVPLMVAGWVWFYRAYQPFFGMMNTEGSAAGMFVPWIMWGATVVYFLIVLMIFLVSGVGGRSHD